MARWLKQLGKEIVDLADSDPPASGIAAGELYKMATHLDPQRVEEFTRLPNPAADIRYWDYGDYSLYIEIDGEHYTVLHVAKVRGALRVNSDAIAVRRARSK